MDFQLDHKLISGGDNEDSAFIIAYPVVGSVIKFAGLVDNIMI